MMKVHIKIFWIVRPCSIAIGYQCFKGPCYLYLQGQDGGSRDTTHKTSTLPSFLLHTLSETISEGLQAFFAD
jgi:hypothetical protein